MKEKFPDKIPIYTEAFKDWRLVGGDSPSFELRIDLSNWNPSNYCPLWTFTNDWYLTYHNDYHFMNVRYSPEGLKEVYVPLSRLKDIGQNPDSFLKVIESVNGFVDTEKFEPYVSKSTIDSPLFDQVYLVSKKMYPRDYDYEITRYLVSYSMKTGEWKGDGERAYAFCFSGGPGTKNPFYNSILKYFEPTHAVFYHDHMFSYYREPLKPKACLIGYNRLSPRYDEMIDLLTDYETDREVDRVYTTTTERG